MSRTRLVAAAAGVVCVLAVLASLAVFIWPRQDRPAPADAVVVLSGDHGERLPVAMRLLEQGLARVLVFDGTPDRLLEGELCAHARTFEAVCLRPQPDNTRAEARAAARLGADRGWRRIIVVTSSQHVPRARLLFDRCFDGEVDVLGDAPRYGRADLAKAVVHEWLAVAHALTIGRGC